MRPPRDVCISPVCHYKKSAQQGHGIRTSINGSRGFFLVTKAIPWPSVSAGGRAPATLFVPELVGPASGLEVSSRARYYQPSLWKFLDDFLERQAFQKKLQERRPTLENPQ